MVEKMKEFGGKLTQNLVRIRRERINIYTWMVGYRATAASAVVVVTLRTTIIIKVRTNVHV
jgi:hypothetical protein